MNAIVASHFRWAARNGRKPPGCFLDPDDVLSLGLEAVWIAVRSFDPGLGRSFRYYAGLIFKRKAWDAVKAKRCRVWPVTGVDWRRVTADSVRFLEVKDDSPGAAPCRECGTTGGRIRKGRTQPIRNRGLCESCYERSRRQEV